MAIAISANDERQPSGVLSPTGIKAQYVEGGGPSSVQMGQENVIALLLQQQEEVLREIRDQKKVRRLVCISVNSHRQQQSRHGISDLFSHRAVVAPRSGCVKPCSTGRASSHVGIILSNMFIKRCMQQCSKHPPLWLGTKDRM